MVNNLSQAAIGRALGLSPPAMTKLKKQGMPVDSVESAQAWRSKRQNIAQRKPLPEGLSVSGAPLYPPAPPKTRERAPVDPDAPAESQDKARTRREIAEADLAELKLAEQLGELVSAADVRAAQAKLTAGLREALLQIPARMASVLAAESNQARCHDLLQAELHQVLAQMVRT